MHSYLDAGFRAFVFFLVPASKSWALFKADARTALVTVQQVAGLEGELACGYGNCNAAIDGINIDHARCAGDGRDLVDEFFVGGDDEDGGVVGASVIGGDDEAVDLAVGHAVELLQNQLHFRRGRGAHHEGDGLAIRPMIVLGFADFDQIGDPGPWWRRTVLDLLETQRDIAGRRQRGADEYENRNAQEALVRASLVSTNLKSLM